MALILNPQLSRIVPNDEVDIYAKSAVPIAALTLPAIQACFANNASFEPATVGDGGKLLIGNRPLRAAAVMILLIYRNTNNANNSNNANNTSNTTSPTVLFCQRSATLRDHAGQISFPGGARDATDEDLIHTALRETEEEIGIDPSRIAVLGTLPTYHTVTNFMVTPVVGVLQGLSEKERLGELDLTLSPAEVDVAFEVPLAFLMDSANHQRRCVDTALGERCFTAMPYVDAALNERFIWGATAGMLRNMQRKLLA